MFGQSLTPRGVTYDLPAGSPEHDARHSLDGKEAVKLYVASLGPPMHGNFLALFVDESLTLLATEVVGRANIARCNGLFAKSVDRGKTLKAAGFILVYNQPASNPLPSKTDRELTRQFERASRELNLPLLSHLVIAGDQVRTV